MADVEFLQVGKDYPGNPGIVDGVDLTIEDGEFIVLVGPSGCGKSTTLRMLAGLEEISRGTVRIGGRRVNDLPPKDRDIAMVFQNYALYPHMTVLENMAFALKMKGERRAEREKKVRETAEVLGISALLDRKPAQLSGGQRQRVAVGRAMVRKPAVYLFDEPLSNLDARLRVEMRAELRRLHQTLRTTTVYVTHDQEEAMTLGDRVVVMSGGKVQQVAPPLEIFESPANRFVAGFLGTPPMNFVEGTLTASGPLAFTGAGIRVELDPVDSARLLGWRGKDVVLGVRPEHLELHPAGSGQSPLPVTAEVLQPLGSMQDAFVATSTGFRIVARVKASRSYREGDALELGIDPIHVHLFEPGEYGANLTLQDGPAVSRAQSAAPERSPPAVRLVEM